MCTNLVIYLRMTGLLVSYPVSGLVKEEEEVAISFFLLLILSHELL